MPISAVLFDLDNTIYPASSGVMKGIDIRITEYVQNLLGLEIEQAPRCSDRSPAAYSSFGTRLALRLIDVFTDWRGHDFLTQENSRSAIAHTRVRSESTCVSTRA